MDNCNRNANIYKIANERIVHLYLMVTNTIQSFFAKPTPRRVVEYIYNQILLEHETGGREYRYQLPPGISISFANEVVEKLCHYIHDADIIEMNNGWIVIEWS